MFYYAGSFVRCFELVATSEMRLKLNPTAFNGLRPHLPLPRWTQSELSFFPSVCLFRYDFNYMPGPEAGIDFEPCWRCPNWFNSQIACETITEQTYKDSCVYHLINTYKSKTVCFINMQTTVIHYASNARKLQKTSANQLNQFDTFNFGDRLNGDPSRRLSSLSSMR